MFYYIIFRTGLKPIGARAYDRLFKYKQQHPAGFTENNTELGFASPKTAMIIFTCICTEQTFWNLHDGNNISRE